MKRKYPNVIRCKNCRYVLVSNHRHDFVKCICFNETFVDGGYDYLRYGGKELNLIQVLKVSAK